MRRPPLLVRRPRLVAAKREGISGVVFFAAAAAAAQNYGINARPNARSRARLSRVGSTRHLLWAVAGRVFRHRAQSTRCGENPSSIPRLESGIEGGSR